MRKFIGPFLTLLLVAGVGAAIYLSVGEQLSQFDTVQVRGLIGSEKMGFFQDPRVIEALQDQGLQVDVKKAGSREIATRHDLANWDFAFPAGVPAAEKIQRENQTKRSYQVAYTPMVVASWKPIVESFEASGIVAKREGVFYVIDMKRLVELIDDGKRWTDLPGNTAFPARKAILINSTDIRRSNSAAMYLALASYIYNGEAVVDSQAQAETLVDRLAALFIRQGYTEHSSAVPFNDYLVMGMGKAPMVMAYEAQYLFAAANGQARDEMQLLYPEPTIFTKHVLVALTEAGERLGEAFMNDARLQELMIEHGWRNENRAAFERFVKAKKLAVPSVLFNVIEPPAYEITEAMIQAIETEHYGGAH